MAERGASGGRRCLRAAAVAILLTGALSRSLSTDGAYAGPLPVPCVAGTCGANGPSVWVTSGQATLVQPTANALQINQTSDRALLNWASFNVGADSSVVFNQPGTTSIALNRIYQADPSKILGAVRANGQIYLINQNGFLFGPSSTVNVGGLLASTLQLSDTTFAQGLLSPALSAAPALAGDAQSGSITVDSGAQIATTASGQRIVLAGSAVTNAGAISASGGQVILAAGQKVYLQASTDPALRGLYVEVDGGGTVTNQAAGSVTTEHGNISLIGLAVNQLGRLSATTSVSENGSIRLLARDTISKGPPTSQGGAWTLSPTRGGTLELGSQSVTEVRPDAADTATAVDEQTQYGSSIEMVGRVVTFDGGSQLQAHGGTLSVLAASNPSTPRASVAFDPDARIRVDSGATIDLSGSDVTVPVTRNLLTVELRGNELANDPLQRNGALRGATVVVDARVGTPLFDDSSAVALIGRTVLERTSTGGTVSFDSSGDVAVASGASINVSGGTVTYTPGIMATSSLVKADGTTVDISQASPDTLYAGVVSPQFQQTYDRWGVITEMPSSAIGRYDPGYVQGASAGTIQFLAGAMALDGSFLGTATNGPYQRTAATLAQGGTFIIGAPASTTNVYRAPAVELASLTSPVVVAENTTLPAGTPLMLSTTTLADGGFAHLQIASDSSIVLGAVSQLQLQPGASVSLSAPHVQVDGHITVPAGSIGLTAVNSLAMPAGTALGVFIGDGAALDVRGQWINDALVPPDQQPTGLALTKGGSIALSQGTVGGTLALGSGAQLHASGGAWETRSGAITGGAGGSISLASSGGTALAQQTTTVGDGVVIDAFGVQGAAGGKFSLQVPRLAIGDGTQWLGAQTVGTDTASGGVLRLGTALFSDFGFASVSLVANGSRLDADTVGSLLTVLPGTAITLATQTLLLDGPVQSEASAPNVAGFARAELLPAYQRSAYALSLQSLSASQNTPADYASWGGLTVGRGASIVGAPGSSVQLASRGNLVFDGLIGISAGKVTLSVLAPGGADRGYADRRLVVGADATIDVAGNSVYQPNDSGLLLGTVLGGGSVALTANRGSVAVFTGAQIDFSGSQGLFDVSAGGSDAYVRQLLASVGGSLQVRAEESIALAGTLRGQGGVGDGGAAPGGTLAVALTRSIPTAFSTTYAGVTGPRVVEVISAPGVPTDGYAQLDAGTVVGSGVGTLTLTADDQIALGAGVSLQLAQALNLNAPGIAVLGAGTATASAPYVSVGPQVSVPTRPVASGGAGVLALQAGQMDVVGSVALQQIGAASFSSSGDIDLLGYGTSSAAPGGYLSIMGDLTMGAERIVPSTASQFTIAAGGNDATVRFEQAGSSPGVPLSAAGSLTVNAANIIQGGTLMAPFGSIALNATQSLQLLPGSTTSVSGAGSEIPYGRVDNGNSWVYAVNNAPAGVSGVPQPVVSLTGATVDIGPGAVVDVSGGGDLYAYQWTPGTGGKTDALAPSVTSGLYAILPALGGQSAPYDPMMWSGSGLSRGASIYLAEGSGVPAGSYWLLPARYALLPGAYLVSAVSGYNNLLPGQTVAATDGATIVGGYLSVAEQSNAAATLSGFAVLPGSYAHQLAQYDDHLASAFFPAQAGDSTVRVPLPADSGTLRVAVSQTLQALGQVIGAAASGGESASVEISAPSVEISGGGTGTVSGASELSSVTLNQWGIGRLLVGGTRDGSGSINVTSAAVTLDGDTQLTAGEIVLVARQAIDVNSGAQVRTTSAATGAAVDATRFQGDTALTLSGASSAGAAVLALSDLGYLVPARTATAAGARATINVAAGATLLTDGAVAIDSGGAIRLGSGSVEARNGYWSLGAAHVVFGNAAADGLAIDSTLLGELQSARAVRISSAGSIDLAQGTMLAAASGSTPLERLALTATRIDNLAANATSQFSADRIIFNGTGASASGVAAGSGSIIFAGSEIDLGDGSLGLSGFASSALSSTGLILGTGRGGLSTAGNLTLTASALTAASGAQVALAAAQGNVQLQAAGDAAPATGALKTGGTVAISGESIVLDGGRILAPSGVVKLSATNDVALNDGACIDVGGLLPAGGTIGSAGGAVSLTAGGALQIASSAALNVAGGAHADAGSLQLQAGGAADVLGTLSGAADSDAVGGQFSIVAGSLADFDPLTQQLQRGGFTDLQSFHVGSGDLSVGAGSTISARQIELIADTGAVNVTGALTATSAARPGAITIDARTGIGIAAAATLDANSSDPTQYRGGTVELATTAGALQIDPAAQVRASGQGHSGRLIVRAPVSASGTDVAVQSLPSDLGSIDAVIIEPDLPYALASSAPAASAFDTIAASVGSYAAGATPNILARLAPSAANVVVRPFVDLTYAGDLTLPALDFSGSAWRFGGQPAVVSVRATGTLTVAGTVSDGFPALDTGFGTTALDLATTPSTALNLVAGADVALRPGVIVRTGTGDITITAARDIVLGAGASVYTGGIAGAPTVQSFIDGSLATYPDQGGSIRLAAGRDLIGSVVTQPVSDWQPRGLNADGTASLGIDFSAFGWNVGALGGGDVAVSAGRDIRDLSAAVADSLIEASDGSSLHLGGGYLNISSGRDVASGLLYVGRGLGSIRALGALSASGNRMAARQSLGTLLVSGDASYRIAAVGDVLLQGEVQADALVPTRASDAPLVFLRYGQDSELSVQSAGGSVEIHADDANADSEFIGGLSAANSDASVFSLYPATVRLAAFGSDVTVAGGITAVPSTAGTASLYAARDIDTQGFGGISLSDVPLSAVPTAAHPSEFADLGTNFGQYTLGVLHQGDVAPASVYAGRDIVGLTLKPSEALQITAGRDIVDLNMAAQNVDAGSVTAVSAGRDIYYTINGSSLGMAVGGPGVLEVLAGRNLDLGYSTGITTTGSLLNGNLPSGGADLIAMAGLGANISGTVGATAFLSQIISANPDERQQLIQYVSAQTGTPHLDFATAAALFGTLSPQQQLPLLAKVLFEELVASGRAANSTPGVGFTRGFDALEALFAGSTSTTGPNPYKGDVALPFSRIYTLGGGAVALLAPGGKVDVGLANPPTNTNIVRGPAQLGIVAQKQGNVDILANGDVLVNQSRVFTLGGGNIAVWSSAGNIDAGRGAKSAISAPPPTIVVDAKGNVTIDVSSAVSGSGIRTIITAAGTSPGDVDLMAPVGYVNAGDAGIGSSGNLNIAAARVLGLDNIQVGGTSTGVPPETSGLGVSSLSAAGTASAATNTATSSVANQERASEAGAPLAQSALSWLEVFVLGLGEEDCKPDDVDCLKRQKSRSGQ